MLIVLVAFGCALGGLARYGLGMLVSRYCGEGFPYGTLVVNVVGSFLLGAVLGAGGSVANESGAFEQVYALLGVGFCGGLTTFSTFSLQSLDLVSKQNWGRVAANLGASVLLCMLSCLGGYALFERWFG